VPKCLPVCSFTHTNSYVPRPVSFGFREGWSESELVGLAAESLELGVSHLTARGWVMNPALLVSDSSCVSSWHEYEARKKSECTLAREYIAGESGVDEKDKNLHICLVSPRHARSLLSQAPRILMKSTSVRTAQLPIQQEILAHQVSALMTIRLPKQSKHDDWKRRAKLLQLSLSLSQNYPT